METILNALAGLLGILNTLTPLAVIALLGIVIFMLVSNKTAVFKLGEQANKHHVKLTTNDLHYLPEMADTLQRIENTLQRMEVRMGEDFAHLKARINGKH